jgi:hypothetical protein
MGSLFRFVGVSTADSELSRTWPSICYYGAKLVAYSLCCKPYLKRCSKLGAAADMIRGGRCSY